MARAPSRRWAHLIPWTCEPWAKSREQCAVGEKKREREGGEAASAALGLAPLSTSCTRAHTHCVDVAGTDLVLVASQPIPSETHVDRHKDRHVARHVYIDLCIDMWIDIGVDIGIDMWLDMCI